MSKVVNRYFLQHARSWLLPHNIALSVYSENPPMTKEVLSSRTSLPEEVAIEDLLLTRRAKLRDFLPFPVNRAMHLVWLSRILEIYRKS